MAGINYWTRVEDGFNARSMFSKIEYSYTQYEDTGFALHVRGFRFEST